MSRRTVALTCLVSLVGGILVVAPPAGAETGADDGVIALDAPALQLVPDPSHRRVWVRSADSVQVVDVDAGTVRVVDVDAPRDLALDADGAQAYVTSGNAILEIDAATLTSQRFTLGASHCPSELAAAGGLVHYLDHCRPSAGTATLDPVTGDQADRPWYGIPVSVPGRERIVFSDGPHITVVDATTSAVLAQRDLSYLRWDSPQVSSDGTRLITFGYEADDPVYVRDLDTLASVGTVPFANPDGDVSTLDLLGGSLLVRQAAVAVHDVESGALQNQLRPDAPEYWGVTGVTALGDDVVMSARSRSGNAALFVESEPLAVAPQLTLDLPSPRDVFTPVEVSGSLTDDGVPLTGEEVTLTLEDGSFVRTVVTDSAGAFATQLDLDDHTLLVARWAGGPARPPAVASTSIGFPTADTVLTVSAPTEVDPETEVPVDVHLRTARGADVPDREVDLYRRCDGTGSWTPLAGVTTGPDGSARLSDEPPPCVEVEYLARHERTEFTHVSAAETSTVVRWRSSTLELSTPDEVVTGDTADVEARLLIAGEAAADRTLTLTTNPGGELRTLVTDADGTVTTQIPVEREGYVEVTWHFAGETTVLPVTANGLIRARRLGTVLAATTTEPTVSVAEPITVTGTLVDERGAPVPEAELRLGSVDGALVGSTTPDGSYALEVPPDFWDPQYRVRLVYPGDTARAPAGAEVYVDVRPLAAAITLSGDRDRVSTGDPVTFTGAVSSEGAGGEADFVHVRRVNPDSSITHLPAVPAGADGAFTFTDAPPAAGDVTYVATRLADETHREVSAETEVEVVDRLAVALTITTDQDSYTAGDVAAVSVTADRRTAGVLTVTAQRDGGGPETLYEGPLPSRGYSTKLTVRRTTTVMASVTSTLDREASEAELTVPVRLVMSSSLGNAWGRAGTLWLVSPRTAPRVVTRVSPRRADLCLAYEVQRRVGDRWRAPTITSCHRTDEEGRAVRRLRPKPLGTRWRVRPTFVGDDVNARSRGVWVVFQVRRSS